jgi:hypothetical protein
MNKVDKNFRYVYRENWNFTKQNNWNYLPLDAVCKIKAMAKIILSRFELKEAQR